MSDCFSVQLPLLGVSHKRQPWLMPFLDTHAFDVRSVKRSCVHVGRPFAKGRVPFDTHKFFYRDGLKRHVSLPSRSARISAIEERVRRPALTRHTPESTMEPSR
ncbi:MAG: hypothetical protein C5B57_07730 [Blastocatellia bacterium]|nr:MAG: hypothetical protein C5B57_07730 [Blastocatellia bacterium]